jgi:hypothetical protein
MALKDEIVVEIILKIRGSGDKYLRLHGSWNISTVTYTFHTDYMGIVKRAWVVF